MKRVLSIVFGLLVIVSCTAPTSDAPAPQMRAAFGFPQGGGSGGSGDPVELFKSKNAWCEEFDGNVSNNLVWDHLAATTTGGAVTVGGTAERPGLVLLSTSTSATGTSRIAGTTTAMSFHATDITTVYWLGVSVPVISDGTESYDVYVGFGDSVSTADQADGCYFLAHTVAGGQAGGATSANWQIVCSANSVETRATLDGSTTDTVLTPITVGDSSLSPMTGTAYNFAVACTTARCDFYAATSVAGAAMSDYVRVGSACSSGCSMAETAIPPAIADAAPAPARAFGPHISITKYAGTTATFAYVDGGCLQRPFAVAR